MAESVIRTLKDVEAWQGKTAWYIEVETVEEEDAPPYDKDPDLRDELTAAMAARWLEIRDNV